MANCSNKRTCPCTASGCSNHGKCCDCVAYHLQQGDEFPACFFSAKAEATWDRSFEMLCRDRGVKN